jgi:hypothetical protein
MPKLLRVVGILGARKRKPMARKKDNQVATVYSMSEDRLDEAKKIFDAAIATLASARTYGTTAHRDAAAKVVTEAAENYADALRTHATLALGLARERTRG